MKMVRQNQFKAATLHHRQSTGPSKAQPGKIHLAPHGSGSQCIVLVVMVITGPLTVSADSYKAT